MNGTAIRLVVKSRRRLVRDALCAYLATRPDFTVVGQAGEIESLGELCKLRRPDAILVDAVELTTTKIEALRRVQAASPAVGIVVTYAEASPRALEAAIRAGVTVLVPCCRGLDAVLRRVRETVRPNGKQRPDGLALTEYDMRIVSLLSSGHSVPEMAQLLQISAHTVENHKRRLFTKLGVGSASRAVAVATSLGLVEPAGGEGPGRRPEPGRDPLVVVHGAPGDGLEAVQRALLAAWISFVHSNDRGPLDQEHWARWHRGPIVAVLIDPVYDDWVLPAGLAAHTIIVLSAQPELAAILDAMLRGASAVVRTEDCAGDLATVLGVVVKGYAAMSVERIADLAGWMAVRLADGSPVMPALTARECDVLESIANGHTIRQTARLLGVAAKTVENTQARLYRKLGARNRMEALTIAHRLGLAQPLDHLAGELAEHDESLKGNTFP